MHTVLRLGVSSRTEFEWDFCKRLTQQAGAVFPVLADAVLCEYNACRSAFSRFTANTSSLQDDRQTGNSRLDGSGCAAGGDG